MNVTLRISLLLNFGLLGLAAFLVRWPRGELLIKAEADPRTASASGWPSTPQRSQMPSSLPEGETKTFQWSQIESADYPTYIANLRAIGCPEQTIRDIITADVGAAFAPRRTNLERAQAAAPESGPLAKGSALASLAEEEARVVAYLLESQIAAPEVDGQGRTPARAARNRALNNRPVVMPLVLQEVDLAALNLDASRLQVIGELRQGFVDDVGGPNQDPSDPAYRERWLKSQAESDELLRGFIGLRAYQEYELQAATPAPEGITPH
jgi:hypothetical protein